MANTTGVLTSRQYKKLVGDLQKLVVGADDSASADKIEAFWSVGERIAGARLSEEVGYHNSVLRDLARDSGIGLRNLQRALVFRELYKKAPTTLGLTWSHYRSLLTISSLKERSQYEVLAVKQGMNARELAAAIRAGIDGDEGDVELQRPEDPEYLYRAEVLNIVDGDTLDLNIYLGFETFRKQRIRLAQINTAEAGKAKGRAAKLFVTKQLMTARFVVVKTERADLHGRYVAHLFYSTRETSIADCFANGKHLNEVLIASGVARLAG